MISLESRSLDDLPTSEIMSLYVRVDSELLRVRQFTKDYTELARLTQEFDALEAILEQRIRNGE